MLRIILVIIGGALFAGTTLGAQPTSYIYVESNISSVANQNSVFGFANDGAGNLTPLSGSPFLTSGTGVAEMGAVNADQEVVANAAGTALYAVNGHTNTIAGFAIHRDGTLTTIAGSPYPSGGQDPVSIGLAGKFLAVANKNLDPNQNNSGHVPNYTTFSVQGDGSLIMNVGGTHNLTKNSGPSQALVLGSHHVMFGLEMLTSRIASFRYDKTGLLTELNSVTPPDGNAFLGEIAHPSLPALYAALPVTDQMAVYKFNNSGVMSHILTLANPGGEICWLTMNADGTRLYTGESLTDTLTVYDTTNALNPVQIQHVTLSATDGPVINIQVDPTGDFLYALAGHGIHTFNVDTDGMLTETVDPVVIPTSTDDIPIGLAVVRR
jgi:6-phosphogluconolactonase (cycloisomerase 2 family)